MPPRSAKMKRRIFGFQRRVWWPKWTPASSSSRMETAPALVDCHESSFRIRLSSCAGGVEAHLPQRRGTRAAAGPPGSRDRVGGKLSRERLRGRRRDPAAAATRRRRARPVTGCAKASRAAWRNWRSSPRSPAHAVRRVAGDRQVDRGEVDADLVRPPRLEPHAQERVARQQLLELEVRDRRARRVGVERMPQAVVPVAADRRVDRPAARARPPDDEREVLARRARGAGRAAAAARTPPASARRRAGPDVSRSRRWTIPGRSSSPPAAPAPTSACASVPPACPGAGMHDDARRLVDDEEVLVRVRRSAGRAPAAAARSPGSRRRRARPPRRPRACGSSRRARRPRRTAPAASSRSAAPRDPTSGSPAR